MVVEFDGFVPSPGGSCMGVVLATLGADLAVAAAVQSEDRGLVLVPPGEEGSRLLERWRLL